MEFTLNPVRFNVELLMIHGPVAFAAGLIIQGVILTAIIGAYERMMERA